MSLAKKEFRNIRRGRISALREVRRQQRLRNNLERQLYRRLTSLFRKFVLTRAHLIKEYGVFDLNSSIQDLNEELLPTMSQHYRKIFRAVYQNANELHDRMRTARLSARLTSSSLDFCLRCLLRTMLRKFPILT